MIEMTMYNAIHQAIQDVRWKGGDPHTIVMNDNAWYDLSAELEVMSPVCYRDDDPKRVTIFAGLPVVFIDGFPDEPDEPWFNIARSQPK